MVLFVHFICAKVTVRGEGYIYILIFNLEAGFDVIFVESVGVGQSEMRLADLTDLFVLCAAPGAGDDLQAMKRGINEMADLILLNKAEEPMTGDARRALMELRAAQTFRLRPSPVLAVSAMKNQGIEAVWSTLKCLESESRVLNNTY